MTVELNERAYEHARQLIDEGRFVLDERDDWSEHQPSAQQENEFIDGHGYTEYGRWHLEIDDERPVETKARYRFPYGVDWSTGGWPATPTAPTVQNGPWAGAVTPTKFTAVYRLAGATAARLVASTSTDLTTPVASSWITPDSDGIVKLPQDRPGRRAQRRGRRSAQPRSAPCRPGRCHRRGAPAGRPP